MNILLIIYIAINIVGLIMCFVGLTGGYVLWGNIFNPKNIYKNIKVNWFGAYLLATIAFICMTPAAIIYWLCKLCTVGRR